jgi:hypothetical protein
MGIFGAGIAIALASSMAAAQTGFVGFNSPTKGVEVGFEQQIERIENEAPDFRNRRVVQRTYARVHGTLDWQVYENVKGDTFDVGVKAGVLAGQYKGSKTISDEFGSLTRFRGGVNSEISGVYTKNLGKISPFVGVRAEAEWVDRPRFEWQGDALAGVRLNVTDTTDLSLQYSRTLAHGFNYYDEDDGDDNTYRQDDGQAIAIVGTKYMTDNTSHSLKISYENFEKSDVDNAFEKYEPDTDNWLVTYKRTF